MPSDSVETFLDLARANHLFEPHLVDDLLRQPDLPQSDLTALCRFLVGRGVLTEYQASKIREGRSEELSFAGYSVVDEIGPCPGGMAYRAIHPSNRTPLLLRRLRTDWLAPADNAAAYLSRAQAVALVAHPHLLVLREAGVHRDEPYVVLELFDGADLNTLVNEIGPMPVYLAAEYIRQAATGLAAAHARGITHGDIRPQNLIVGPLVPMSQPRPDGTLRYRPAATATVKVCELGLIPLRAKVADWPAQWALEATYLPPERRESGTPTAAGDVFMLGAVLHFLLTSRPPDSVPLAVARPDCPPELADLFHLMTATPAVERPPLRSVVESLEAILRTAKSATTPAPSARDEAPLTLEPVSVEPTVEPAPQPQLVWVPPPAPESDESPRIVRTSPQRGVSRKTLWLGVLAFLGMNMLALLIWVFVVLKR
jgi:serine/threonine protein kinase